MRKYICVRNNMFRWLWHIWGVCCFCKRPQKTEEETLQNLCDLYSSTAFCCLELWSPAVMSSTPTHNSQTITLCNLRLSNSNRHLSECCSPVAVWEIPIRLLSPEWAYVQRVPRKGCQKRTFYVGQRLLSVVNCYLKYYGSKFLPYAKEKFVRQLCSKWENKSPYEM